MTVQDKTRQSLLNLFSPPNDKLWGVFGLVCGLSAEEQFMDCVLEQFSSLSRKQRKHSGHLSLVLFMDAHNKPIQSLPGLYNPWLSETKWKRIKLMHAKVALLSFGESVNGKPNYYRLIVSTGNWTKEAVNNSINLVWYCDYDTTSNENQKQEAKDIAEAVIFFQQLTGINNSSKSYYRIAYNIKKYLKQFLKAIPDDIKPPKRGYRTRFIANLGNGEANKFTEYFKPYSIGFQVIKKFCDSKIQRNFIICGSGFFEQPASEDEISEPEVLQKLVGHLKGKILTNEPEKWLVINPATSGAAGQWIKSITTDDLDWSICLPKHPDFDKTPYSFHAKYVFIANYNNRNDSVTSGLLYLGSGNLSKQGFALGPGTGGNIEVGVVVETGRYNAINDLCIYLGIDPEEDLDTEDMPDEIESEEEQMANTEIQTPPPIDSCVWYKETGKLQWKWMAPDWENVILHYQSIQSGNCMNLYIDDNNVDFSSGVKLSAKKKGKCFEWIIPVFTEGGNFCSPPPRPKSAHEIIDDLFSFPATSFEDEEDDNGDDGLNDNDPSTQKDKVKTSADLSDFRNELESFPLHLATTLIETIAERNQQISEGQFPDWIEHLKRTLVEEMKPEIKVQLRILGIDTFKVLIAERGFAPEQSSKEYKKAIKKIIKDWSKAHETMD